MSPRYVTQACHRCGVEVLRVRAHDGKDWGTDVSLEPTAPVYARESDGEGGAIWVRVQGEILAQHVCKGGEE